MHLSDLLARAFQISIVRHDVVRDSDLPRKWQLRFDSSVGFAHGEAVPRDQPQPLHGLIRAHHHEGRKALVGAGFDEECPFIDHVGRRVILISLNVLRAGSTDARVHDGVERFPRFFVSEDELSDFLAIEAAGLIEDIFAKFFDDRLEPRRTRLDDLACEIVRIDDWDSQVGKHFGDGGLSARDPARQPYHRFHGGRVFVIARLGQDDLGCATALRMRAVVQRVNKAEVRVDGESVGAIERGLLVYLGAARGDGAKDVRYTADKIAGLRVFPNDEGKMSLSATDIGGAVLVVSQFTLFGDVRRGRRPSFDGAAEPGNAERLYLQVVEALRAKGLTVETGTFRAMMLVDSVVDGPVTIQIDSQKLY
jgi:D-tyrosyl-tRNA(Tyr) deacylase